MTVDINSLSNEELEAGLLSDLAALSGNEEQPIDSGTNEEEEETSQTEDDSVEAAEETEEEEQQQPKKKGVAKILAERNAERKQKEDAIARIKELEAMLGENKESDAEYVKLTAKQIAQETIKDETFFASNPIAEENREAIEEYKQTHNLSNEDALNLFMIKHKPEEFVSNIKKADSKKFAPPAIASTKLRAEKSPGDLTTAELKAQLNSMYAKGEVEF